MDVQLRSRQALLLPDARRQAYHALRSVEYARRLPAAALDEKCRGQAPERILVQLGDGEPAPRQPADRGGGARARQRRRRHGEDAELATGVDVSCDRPLGAR
jgi:hypothetical protein